MEAGLFSKTMKAGTEVQTKVKERWRAEVFEVAICEDGLDAIEVGGESAEFLLVTRRVCAVDLLHAHEFHGVNVSLVFGIPVVKSRFGDIEPKGDVAKAPAVGAKDYEVAQQCLFVLWVRRRSGIWVLTGRAEGAF